MILAEDKIPDIDTVKVRKGFSQLSVVKNAE